MNKKSFFLILILVLLLLAVAWILILKKPSEEMGVIETSPQPGAEATAEKPDRFEPELNNVLETSVTVINPNEQK